MSIGEYLTLYAIIGVAIIAILGYLFGAALGGAVVFFVAAALGIILIYAILSRAWRFLLHGSASAGSDGGNGGEI